MNTDDLEKKLDSLNMPKVPAMQHQIPAKLAILNAKKSARATLWLMMIPVLMLGSALVQTWFHVNLPPWVWLQKNGQHWPTWIRFGIFALVVIVIPLVVVFLNLLSIIWLQYDRKQRVLHISVRIRLFNIIIIIIAGLFALLFIGHTIAEYMQNGG